MSYSVLVIPLLALADFVVSGRALDGLETVLVLSFTAGLLFMLCGSRVIEWINAQDKTVSAPIHSSSGEEAESVQIPESKTD